MTVVTKAAQRPEPFSVNFQREVQAMLFCLQWKAISYEEMRRNLKKLGMDLDDERKPIPTPPVMYELPEEEDDNVYPLPEGENPIVHDDVIEFIEEARIPPEVYSTFPPVVFSTLEAFTMHLNKIQES